jgi:hypothetical protein
MKRQREPGIGKEVLGVLVFVILCAVLLKAAGCSHQ